MRRPLFLFRVAFVALALAAGGCRTGGSGASPPAEEPASDPVLLTPSGGGPRYPASPDEPPEWFEARIAEAEGALAEGRLREGLERVYEARAKHPGSDHAQRLDDMLRRLNEQVLRLETLRGRLHPEKEAFTFGEPLRVRLVLENRGTRPLHLPARQRGTSGSILEFHVERREVDVRAQVVTTHRRVYRPLPEDLDLEPGGSVEQVLDLGLLGNDRPLDGFRTFTVGGRLRPAVLEVGGLRRWEAIALEPAVLRSFRPNYEHLTDDPVARLGQALEKFAPVHLLTAAALVPPGRRQEAVDLLVAALEGDRPIDWTIFAALHHLTGIELGRDTEAWRAWWPRVRATYFAEPAPERDPDRPTFDREAAGR